MSTPLQNTAIIGEPEVVEDAAVAETSGAWRMLKDAATAIRELQVKDGSIPDASDPSTGSGADCGLERSVVAEAARSAPGISARRRTGRGPRLLGHLLLLRGTLSAAATATAGSGAGDLSGRVAQRRTDLVDLELDGRAVVALTVLVGALAKTTLRDHTHALRQ